MTEILFVLTTIYVAYVVYTIFNEQKTNVKSTSSVVLEQTQPQVQPVSMQEPVAVEKAPIAMVAASLGKGTVRDPKTGEVASASANYRFTKRWIKDALVSEGFLEKVYKNNELDSASEALIKEALLKLEAMDKYRP